jgi:hypothetical protein
MSRHFCPVPALSVATSTSPGRKVSPSRVAGTTDPRGKILQGDF